MKVIETKYKGYYFRSRIEARWAVFFDAVGIEYEYEKEGYDLDGVWYLPDFWLPKLNIWIEVKGADPTEIEQEKCIKLATATNKSVVILYGNIPFYEDEYEFDKIFSGTDKYQIYFSDGGGDNCYYFCECNTCGFVGIEFAGRSERLSCEKVEGCKLYSDKAHNYMSNKVMKAFGVARSYRF